MNASIKITGTDEIKKMFDDLLGSGDRSAEKCLTVTINETVRGVRAKLTAEIPIVLDKPRPITKSSIKYETKSVSQNRLTASVYVENHPPTNTVPPSHWLWHNIHGGRRPLKASEQRLIREKRMPINKMYRPGPDMPVDSYGNITSSNIIKLFSKLRVFNEGGYTSNAAKSDGYNYFTTEHGVFKRRIGDTGRPQTLLVYIRQSRPYKKRFDFYGIGQAEADRIMMPNAIKALDYALRNY